MSREAPHTSMIRQIQPPTAAECNTDAAVTAGMGKAARMTRVRAAAKSACVVICKSLTRQTLGTYASVDTRVLRTALVRKQQSREGEGGREDCPPVPSEGRVWPPLHRLLRTPALGSRSRPGAASALCVTGAPETEILW